VRGKKVRTTVSDPSAERAPDLVKRSFVASAPNRCWVADFTHVPAYAGTVYVAFVVDTFSRRIVGWSAATTKATPLVLACLEMGLWQRDCVGHNRERLIHHSDAGSQYTSFRLAAHLAGENIAASIGTIGDALDNALMESTIGLYKTELLNRRKWRTRLELANAIFEYLEIFHNRQRRHSALNMLTPIEHELRAPALKPVA
jgi:putative transposase